MMMFCHGSEWPPSHRHALVLVWTSTDTHRKKCTEVINALHIDRLNRGEGYRLFSYDV